MDTKWWDAEEYRAIARRLLKASDDCNVLANAIASLSISGVAVPVQMQGEYLALRGERDELARQSIAYVTGHAEVAS